MGYGKHAGKLVANELNGCTNFSGYTNPEKGGLIMNTFTNVN